MSVVLQNWYFTASWMIRGAVPPASDVTRPKSELLIVVCGLPGVTVFSTLNASTRN
jgi:hypothetical protein